MTKFFMLGLQPVAVLNALCGLATLISTDWWLAVHACE
jgi:hypothetical protein